jgi:hypothetical protein
LRGLSPNYHIHVSVSYLYIPTIDLPFLLQENMWTDPSGNVEIGTEEGQFLFWENINEIFVAKWRCTVTKVTDFPVPSRDVTYQIIS